MRSGRGRLLARIGALVALSAAGAGCQSVPLLSSLANRVNEFTGRAVAVTPPIVIGPAKASTPAPEPPSTSQVAWRNLEQEASPHARAVTTSNWNSLARDREQPVRVGAASTWRTARAVADSSDSVIPVNLQPAQAATPSSDIKKPEATGPAGEPPLPGPQPLMVVPNQTVAMPAPHGEMAHHPSRPPFELAKMPLPPYIVESPDILLVESIVDLPKQKLGGQHLVRPDGTISLGIYGSVLVAGMTLEQIRAEVANTLNLAYPDRKNKLTGEKNPITAADISVDVLAYNSKVYYIITDGGGFGEQVYRQPITGNETVLDAISLINGLPPVASKKKIWVARRIPDQHHGGYYNNILPVDWCSITKGGTTSTNYQVLPGDRIYVAAERIIHVDSAISKFISPIERLLGVTLLGSETVNSIRNPQGNTGLLGR